MPRFRSNKEEVTAVSRIIAALIVVWGLAAAALPARAQLKVPRKAASQKAVSQKSADSKLVAKAARQDGEPDPADQVILQLLVIEVQGDTQPALREAGVMRGSEIRPVSASGTTTDEGHGDALNQWLRTLAEHCRVDVLSRPQVRAWFGLSASFEIVNSPQNVAYLVRTGERSFELKEMVPETPLGIRVTLTPQRVTGESEKIEIAPLHVSITTIDGRESLTGLDADVGKPIVSTRSLQSSLTLVHGQPSMVLLPGPPGRQAILFLTARSIGPPVQPGEVFSDPAAGERAIRERGKALPNPLADPQPAPRSQRRILE